MRSDATERKQPFIGLAVRGGVVPPFVRSELATAVRDDEPRTSGVRVRVVPVPVSLLIAPVPLLFGCFGAGWYRTTYASEVEPALPPEIHEEFGTHIGMGLRIPLLPHAAADLQARYVAMHEEPIELSNQPVDNSGWTLLAGMAMAF